jgi:hypothetical protein
VNVLAGQTDVSAGRLIVPVWNIYQLADCGDLAPLLRRVIFVGKSALGHRFNFQRIRLRVINCADSTHGGDAGGEVMVMRRSGAGTNLSVPS